MFFRTVRTHAICTTRMHTLWFLSAFRLRIKGMARAVHFFLKGFSLEHRRHMPAINVFK